MAHTNTQYYTFFLNPYTWNNTLKAKNHRDLRPLGFLALELPRDNIHQDTHQLFTYYIPKRLKLKCFCRGLKQCRNFK